MFLQQAVCLRAPRPEFALRIGGWCRSGVSWIVNPMTAALIVETRSGGQADAKRCASEPRAPNFRTEDRGSGVGADPVFHRSARLSREGGQKMSAESVALTSDGQVAGYYVPPFQPTCEYGVQVAAVTVATARVDLTYLPHGSNNSHLNIGKNILSYISIVPIGRLEFVCAEQDPGNTCALGRDQEPGAQAIIALISQMANDSSSMLGLARSGALYQ
ncbi:hypothetical protein DFP72DRAFT_849237 [Ephemerocybe angulata]|uniref:Uncharacterized protein n=1 Tax=Ephemerocybe angulata TaxID=980116 RepID=A0A8H6HU25_9AGAR|nr:hypothetical protein DFP72DRAFT_849237 [Tulosesus angulatus]